MSEVLKSEIPELLNMKKRPEIIYFKGNEKLLEKRKISIVGSRKPNTYTRTFTARLSSILSSLGICIVSGAAMGVDAIAHTNAKPENTIAVMANGLNIKYPSVNKKLITQIEEKGLTLSSYKDGEKARPYTFIHRNEIVVALGEVLIITQADLNSGTMHSAKYAINMGKEIFVLPHRLDDSLGTNELLEKGLAKPIYNIDNFIKRFGLLKPIDDEFLLYCKNNPTYEEAISLYNEKLLEYEINEKIKITNGRIFLV